METKKHLHFKDFFITRGGLIICVLSIGVILYISLSMHFWFRQWLGLLCGIVFYSSATFTAIRKINKGIDRGEIILEDKK